MNIKLIVGSILGISSIGGATGYYFLKPENTTKNEDNTGSETKSSESLDTNKEGTPELQTQPNSALNNLKPAELPPASGPKEPGPDSRPTTSGEPEARKLDASGSSGGDNDLSQRTQIPNTEDVQRAVET